MIPANNLEEFLNYCRKNSCNKNCLVYSICMEFRKKIEYGINFSNEDIVQEIIRHNRKEKLEKLLA